MQENDQKIRAERIAQLNDAFRTNFDGGQVVITQGILGLGDDAVAQTLMAVRHFDTFTESNDPYGEHDFGMIEIEGNRIYWKIDYYDLALMHHSFDPADPNVTRRVMTVMLAGEY